MSDIALSALGERELGAGDPKIRQGELLPKLEFRLAHSNAASTARTSRPASCFVRVKTGRRRSRRT